MELKQEATEMTEYKYRRMYYWEKEKNTSGGKISHCAAEMSTRGECESPCNCYDFK